MLYSVAQSFVKIDETQGIIQNASSGNDIEISDSPQANSGLILKPGESLSFSNQELYVRTIGNKSTAVRVVPFVQGFTAGSGSSSSSTETLNPKSTSIIINSITPEGHARQETFSSVNPTKTKSEFVTFGQMVTGLTNDTYKNTIRIDKTICDEGEDDEPQSGTLIAYLPFTEDLTDNCGNEWSTYGNPQIQNGKLYLNGSSYLQNDSISDKIGSDIWTIHYYAAKGDGRGNPRYTFGTFNANYGTSGMVTNSWIAINHYRQQPAIILYNDNENMEVNAPLNTNQEYHFALSYDGSLLRLFVDGVLKATKIFDVKLGGAFCIGRPAGRLDSGDCYVGTMRNFTVLKGVAYTKNFTPE